MKLVNLETFNGVVEYAESELYDIELKSDHGLVTFKPFKDETKITYAVTLENAESLVGMLK